MTVRFSVHKVTGEGEVLGLSWRILEWLAVMYSMVLKMAVAQLVKKFPAFYRTRSFITVLTLL
jgi:hypothetical protein